MGLELFDHQKKAILEMKNGCILCGGVGSGKSMTAIAYYHTLEGGSIDEFIPMGYPKGYSGKHLISNAKNNTVKDLYIITTARKRDECEWNIDLAPFLLSPNNDINIYSNNVIIDSWNNISKYTNVENAFFIFDEQRVVGSGVWVDSFLKISKKNQWVLLSATPGDTWSDYLPVFIANGYFKNKTEFVREHVIYSPYSKFPKIDRYINMKRLVRLRDNLLIEMDFDRKTIPHHVDIFVDYDKMVYKTMETRRWNIWKNEPIKTAGELCYALRKLVNSDPSRILEVTKIAKEKEKVIIFYNFDYELDILKNNWYGDDFEVAEWNGHKHQPVPTSNKWVYLVQYTAGAEGWNCILSDTVIFYSQHYSFKIVTQSSGRIDRLNTPYINLYYYHLKTKSSIDVGISRALNNKKKFNEGKFIKF